MAAMRLQTNHAAWLLLGWYAIASILTYLLYARDQQRATAGICR